MDDTTFSDVIREAVVESGMTSYGLGRAADVAPAVIQRFLAGERGLNLCTVEKLARVLELRLLKVRNTQTEPSDSISPEGKQSGPKKDKKVRSKKHSFMLDKDGVIRIGDGIWLRLLDVRNRSVRFAIQLPPDTTIMRGEL